MQVELLDRKKWNTRIDLANAIFGDLKIWHNRKRRHGQLGWLTPIEFERNRIIPWHENPSKLDYAEPGTHQTLKQPRAIHTGSRSRLGLVPSDGGLSVRNSTSLAG